MVAFKSVVESVPPLFDPPDPGFNARRGYERLQDWLHGVGVPPFARLTGIVPRSVEHGTVDYEMPVSSWYRTHAGIVPSGIMAFLADAPLGAAILSTLPERKGITTSQVSIDYLRPVTSAVGSLAARGEAVHVGRTTAMSTAWITDDQGQRLAHATTRCVVLGAPKARSLPHASGEFAMPSPLERSARGVVLTDDELDTRGGLDWLNAELAGEIGASPFGRCTGILPTEADVGRVTFKMPTSPWYRSPGPFAYGGALLMFVDTVLSAAVQTKLPAGWVHAPMDLTAHFVRPVPTEIGPLHGVAEVRHAGRSFVVAEARVCLPDGKVALFGSSSSFLLKASPSVLRSRTVIAPTENSVEYDDRDGSVAATAPWSGC